MGACQACEWLQMTLISTAIMAGQVPRSCIFFSQQRWHHGLSGGHDEANCGSMQDDDSWRRYPRRFVCDMANV